MDILIVPDVHGREFWVNPCNNWNGDIIFLGDYHDPYTFEVSKDKSLKILQELVKWNNARINKPIFLLGNHDISYLSHTDCCRKDRYNSNKIERLIRSLNPKLYYIYNNYIFSHSGILPEWLNNNNLQLADLDNLTYSDKCLYDISYYRGGYHNIGSLIWGDVREYDSNTKLPNYYQIFGHTLLKNEPVITDEYACLDCKKCFILNTETNKIKEYEGCS